MAPGRKRIIHAAVALVTTASIGACSSPHPRAQARPTPGSTESGSATSGSTTSRPPTSEPPTSASSASPAAPAGPDNQGPWTPAGRQVDGSPAVYETTVVPPGGTEPAGVAWMDTRRLAARLYSGSESPGRGPFRYTAPIQPADATALVAAFNGGFQMSDAHGGYFTEGRLVYPLQPGAASLVIYDDGTVAIGAWGTTVNMTAAVASVRQNLVLLVDGGRPTAAAGSADWLMWGNTCGTTSCAHSVPSVEHQWRSGVGVTAGGALVYALGPDLAPVQLAQVLARAGAVTAMELDINPSWTVFVTYSPRPGAPATPADGQRLLSTMQGPATFFEPGWARDFITMSARS